MPNISQNIHSLNIEFSDNNILSSLFGVNDINIITLEKINNVKIQYRGNKVKISGSKKSIKETKYHFRHSSNWIIRLGDGTAESHAKVQSAINDLWIFTGELFEMNETAEEMVKQKVGVDCTKLRSNWAKIINDILLKATLSQPVSGFMKTGGRQGIHTEHLGHLLSDMQYLQRAYPDAKW